MDRKVISKLLGISEKSFYRWKEERLIFKLLEKYFTDKELDEFLKTEKIQKFEQLEFIQKRIIDINSKKYLDSFTNSKNFRYDGLASSYDIFIQFYFYFLVELKELFIQNNYFGLQLHDILMSSISKFFVKRFSESLLEFGNKKLTQEIIQDLNNENIARIKDMQRNTMCFKNWGEDMFLYLEYILKNDLKYFLDSNNKELIFHAVGFNVYFILKEESNYNIKDNIISNIIKSHEKSNKKITIDDIYYHINQLKQNI